jgi:hypothetical protein
MNVSASSKSIPPLDLGEVGHLLAGLERQKEELGPIAAELIEILVRAGVDTQVEDGLTGVRPCSE